jgi:hypothetical protein
MIGEDDKVLLSPFKGFYHSPHEPMMRGWETFQIQE